MTEPVATQLLIEPVSAFVAHSPPIKAFLVVPEPVTSADMVLLDSVIVPSFSETAPPASRRDAAVPPAFVAMSENEITTWLWHELTTELPFEFFPTKPPTDR